MIVRDSYLYIVQHNRDYPGTDAGDTARSTGLMAMCGSKLDQSLIHDLSILDPRYTSENGKRETYSLVRHPYDTRWNRPELTSRDQVITYSAGVVGENMPKASNALLHYVEIGWVNKDILLPHHRLVLCKAAGARVPLFTEVFGRVFMFLHILHLCYFTAPETEVNQTIAMLSRFSNRWMKMLNYLHDDLEKSIMGYWSGVPWRDQKQIGEAMVKYVQEKCK